MRIILGLWFFPLFFFWGWYGLSYYDVSFGLSFFSRELHDVVFLVYSHQTGIPAEKIPGILAGACVFDSFIVLGIAAYRWRAKWWPKVKGAVSAYWSQDLQDDYSLEAAQSGRVPPAE